MRRSYRMKFGGCVVFLLLLFTSMIGGDWYGAVPWPFNGMSRIAVALAELLSPFVSIYFVSLAMKLK
jgi:hypothetical protein